MRTLVALALLGFTLACGWNKAVENEKPSPAQEVAGMPSSPFSGVSGWLGFAVQPRDSRVHPWTPDHPNAKVVIFQPQGWEELAEGAPFTAASSQGLLKLKYSELSEIPFGCDDVPTPMAAFQGPYDLAEELVWIVPGEAEGLTYTPIRPGSGDAKRREWRAADLHLEAKVTGERKGNFTISREGTELWSQDFEQALMAGAEPGDVTFELSDDDTIALPVPMAMVVPGKGQPPVLILKTQGFEGATFSLLALRPDRATEIGSVYVYMCAY